MITDLVKNLDDVDIKLTDFNGRDLITFRTADLIYHTAIVICRGVTPRNFTITEMEFLSLLIKNRVNFEEGIIFDNISHLMLHLQNKYSEFYNSL